MGAFLHPFIACARPARSESIRLPLGASIRTDFLELRLLDSGISSSVTGSSGRRGLLSPSEKSVYFCAFGTLENTFVTALDLRNLRCEMVFNEKYHYQADVYADLDGFLVQTLEPLYEADLVVAAKVPVKLTVMLTKSRIELGFNEGLMSPCRCLEKGDYRYTFALADNETESAKTPRKNEPYYTECTALPCPTSFLDAHEVPRSVFGKGVVKYSYFLTGNPQTPGKSTIPTWKSS